MPRAVLDTPCPGPRCARSTGWSGLAKKWGSARLNDACARALEAESHRRQPGRAHARARPRGARGRALRPGHRRRARFARDPSEFRGRAVGHDDDAHATVARSWRASCDASSSDTCSTPCPSAWRSRAPTTWARRVLGAALLRRGPAPRRRVRRAPRHTSAHLDPAMTLEHWDETTAVTYDRRRLDELVSLRFVDTATTRSSWARSGWARRSSRRPWATSPGAGASACTSSAPTSSQAAQGGSASTTATTSRCASSSASTC